MKYSRKNVARLEPYIPGYQPGHDEKIIKLNTNENPYPPSPLVLQALRNSIGGDLRLYPNPRSESLRRKAADVYGVSKEQVFIGNGSDETISLLFRTFIETDDTVLLSYPTYTYYQTAAEINGSPYQYVETDQDFNIILDRFFDHPAKAAVIVNPNSPTGIIRPPDRLAEFIRAYPGLVVVDETYMDFSGGNYSVFRLVNQCSNLLVLRTFSKSFSLCGIRVGYAFGHPDLINDLDKTRDSYNISALSQISAEAALEDYRHMEGNARKIIKNREWLRGQLELLDFSVLPSAANFLFASHRRLKAADIHQRLAERKIYIRHWNQRRIDNHLRITIGTCEELVEMVRVLKDIIK